MRTAAYVVMLALALSGTYAHATPSPPYERMRTDAEMQGIGAGIPRSCVQMFLADRITRDVITQPATATMVVAPWGLAVYLGWVSYSTYQNVLADNCIGEPLYP